VVLANELIGMVKRYLAAFEITDDTLAIDVIDRVGPMGNFLSESHTLDNFRNDMWFPSHFDRRTFEGWFDAGSEPITAPLHKRAVEILADHKGAKVSAEQADAMDKILSRRG
jgi:trimethylamine--corrinoid protein Co-methyltransferase